MTNTRDEECFTWSVQGGEEIDLVLRKPGGLFGFEFKASDAPRRTPSLTASMASLDLTKVFIIYPGEMDYSLDDRLEAVGFGNLARILPLLS